VVRRLPRAGVALPMPFLGDYGNKQQKINAASLIILRLTTEDRGFDHGNKQQKKHTHKKEDNTAY
jgi:hypothetical protein